MSFVLRRGVKACYAGLLARRKGFCFSAQPKAGPRKVQFDPIKQDGPEDRSFLGRLRVQTGLDLPATIASLQKESVKEFLNRSKNVMPFMVSAEVLEQVLAADRSSSGR